MGLFDEIHCKMPLPGEPPEFVKRCPVFQTYDLGCGMGAYTITKDGQLVIESTMLSDQFAEIMGVEFRPSPMNFCRKRIEMHASNLRAGAPGKGRDKGKYINYTDDGSDWVQIGYVVQIRDDRVSSIKETSRVVSPARKYAGT
jgi:hypothetical protein